jgi:DNA (cytosine-5)-methyltransferase 1
LAYRYPDVPNLGDMTSIAERVTSGEVDAPDVLVGGTPCQAFSIAGLRNSLQDARGQLTLSYVGLANAIDTARHLRGQPATIVVWESVPGVLSTKDNAFGCFLGALAGEDRELKPPGDGRGGQLAWPNAGCVFGPQRTIAWRILDAQYFGVAQRRRRVLLVASAREGFDPTAVLFEQDGMRRDSPPSREARQDVAGTLSSRTTGGGGLGTDFELGGGYSQPSVDDVVGTLEASDGGPDENDAAAGKLVPWMDVSAPVARSVERPRGDGLDTLIAGTLQANGKAAGSATQQDAESGMLIPIAFSMKDHGGDASYDLAPTLRAGNHDTSHANGGQPPAIAFDSRQDCVSSTEVFGALGSSSPQAQAVAVLPFDTTQITSKANVSNPQYGMPCHPLAAGAHAPAVCITGDVTHTLRAEGFDASEDGTGRGQPIVAHAIQAGALRLNPASGPDGVGVQAEVAYTLEARSEVQCAQMGMSVRRLTPRECERLQAYPDDYTLIPWRALSRLQKKAAKHGVSFESVLRERGKILREPTGDTCPDGPRYKALGNSMCTTKMAWLGRRIDRAVAEAYSGHDAEIARKP